MKLLGVQCWYSVPDAATVRADVLDDRLRVAGWEKAVPSRRGPTDALRRSLSDLAAQFPHVDYQPHHEGWGIWGHFKRDGKYTRKGLLKIEIHSGNLRRTWMAPDEHYHPQAERLLAWLSQRYQWYLTHHDTDKIRTCVYATMNLLNIPHVRPGVYFIPPDKRRLVDDLRAVFGADTLDRAEVRFSDYHLPDTPHNRAMLAGDILHNIEEYMEKCRMAVLRYDLEDVTPHPETMRDWLKRLDNIRQTIAYFREHVLGDDIAAPSDLEELRDRIAEIRSRAVRGAARQEDPAA